jgi:cell division protein FtsW
MAVGTSDAPAPAVSAPRRHRHAWLAWLDSPLAAYYLVLGATVALTVIGLVMVLSSSSVESFRQNDSSFTVFNRQAVFAAVGLPLMVLASRVPLRVWKAAAWPMLAVAVAGLLLIFSPLGFGTNGNRNWLDLGSLTVQPSEAAKLALVVWAAAVLARKQKLLHRTHHVLVPVVPGAVLLLVLVLAGHDLGTAMVMMAIAAALLFAGGAPLRVFVAGGAVLASAVFVLATSNQNRMSRITAWSGGCTDDYYGTCWQSIHGKWALATGGWWGVGLGASREKWSYLPEAHNDFIFAIIGEELGLVGTLVVLALFALLGIGLFLVVVRSDDLFVKVATAGVLTWVIGQAAVNIGTVLALLPVIGVPLPLVSSGGSALVTTLVALGMVVGFARRQPGVPQALAARVGVVRRSLAVVPGRAGTPHRRGGADR